MSTRTTVEIDHEKLGEILTDPAGFGRAVYWAVATGDPLHMTDAYSLFGITIKSHHSEEGAER